MAQSTATVYPVKKLVPLSPEMAQAIDDYRLLNFVRTEAQAIRQLIALGLSAAAEGRGNADAHD